MHDKQVINVARTYLPRKEKFHQCIDEIYSSNWVNNNSPLVQKLEQVLASKKHISFTEKNKKLNYHV